MITVKQLLEYSIEHEFMLVAHATYWAVTHGLVTLDDDASKLSSIDVDKAAVEALIQQNALALGTVKLFVITCKNDWYAFYFAKTALEAATLHRQLYDQKVETIVEAPRLLHAVAHFAQTDQEMYLLDYRKQAFTLPFYIGHAKAGRLVFWRF